MDPVSILRQHDLLRTSCREGIIEVMLAAGKPLTEQEIKDGLHGNYDRSTFYRSFRVLEDKGIIHKIIVNLQVVTYALNPALSDRKNHAHFYCERCNRVTCLEEHIVSNPVLPPGYRAENTEMIIRGHCVECRELNS